MNKPLVVLHVFGSMDVGGAELRTIDLLRHLGPEGFEFHFATLSGREGVLRDEVSRLGGTIHPVRLNPAFPIVMWRLMRRERPAVLDSHVATFSGVLLLLGWLARIPLRIAHFRSDGDGRPDTLRRRQQRAVMLALVRRFATDIVGVSPSALTYGYRTSWMLDRRARVIPNGIPSFDESHSAASLRQTAGVPVDAPLVIHVGRPSPEKNRPHTVGVVHAMHERGVHAHLVLVGGSGADSCDVLREIERFNLGRFVHDLGVRTDAVDLISQADALLLTSVREGLPGVVLEAASAGTPVVSSALPGVAFIASSLPGIRCVGLDDPLEQWGEAVIAAIKQGREHTWRARARRRFDASPFSLGSSLAAHRALYRGER